MPSRLAAFAFLAVSCFAAPALGCPPTAGDIYPLAAVLVAVPFSMTASLVLGVFARRWNLGFWGWLKTSIASYGAAASAGLLALYFVDAAFGLNDPATALTVGLTAPLTATTAYIMWIRSRRFLRAEAPDETA